MTEFTHVVPLGANCRLTLNVRRHFDSGESYPFDWWISPLPGVIAALEAGLDPGRLYDPDALHRLGDATGRHRSVEHRAFGIRFVHEFPDMPESIAAPVAWEDRVRQPRERLAHLADKLWRLNAPGHRILFVRFCVHPRGDVALDTEADLDRLRAILTERFDAARIALLPISGRGRVEGCETLAVQDGSEDWKGDFALWTAALASTGYRIVNPRRKPFAWPRLEAGGEAVMPAATVRASPFKRLLARVAGVRRR